jgi:hypothetical protein
MPLAQSTPVPSGGKAFRMDPSARALGLDLRGHLAELMHRRRIRADEGILQRQQNRQEVVQVVESSVRKIERLYRVLPRRGSAGQFAQQIRVRNFRRERPPADNLHWRGLRDCSAFPPRRPDSDPESSNQGVVIHRRCQILRDQGCGKDLLGRVRLFVILVVAVIVVRPDSHQTHLRPFA